MSRCCINPLPPHAGGHFDADLVADAKVFSAWIGGAWPLNRPPLPHPLPGLTSALHVDLKLWQPSKRLGRTHRTNDAQGNALKVARPQIYETAPNWGIDNYRVIFDANGPIDFATPRLGTRCAILEYDNWLLTKIRDLRIWASGLPGVTPGADKPVFLTTIGMAQKPLNVYVKYMSCWAYTGQYSQPPGAFGVPLDPLGLSNFSCALHCPLDNFLLGALSETDIGEYLLENKLLRAIRNKKGWTCAIRQENGSWKPWSKLDCPTAYYALQWFIRRIAMSTWPSGCSTTCFNPSSGIDPEGILKQIFPDAPTLRSKWWAKLNACPTEKFQKSANQTIQIQTALASTIITPRFQMQPEPNILRDIPINPNPNRLAEILPCIKIKGNANQFFGLRIECGHRNNYWGCVFNNGTLAITEPTRNVLLLAGEPVGYPLANPWFPIPGLPAYVAKRRFNTPGDAFNFLATHFVLCACDKQAINKLNDFGVTWIPLCST